MSFLTQEKVKKTILSKYGVNNPYKIDRTVKKRNNTLKLKANEILEKRYKTNIIKYGVDNIFKNENVKNKIKIIEMYKTHTEEEIVNTKRYFHFVVKY